MEDLIAAVIAGIAEFLFEAIFELIFEFGFSFLIRGVRTTTESLRGLGPVYAVIVFLLIGAAIGFGSAIAFPHPLVHPSRVHGFSVIICPLLVGGVMAWIGRSGRKRGRTPTPLENFGYGYVFALGMAIVRFSLVK